MRRSGTEATRTQLQPSKPKREITNITNSQNTKRTCGQPSEQLFPKRWPLSNRNTNHQHGFRKGYSCVTQLIDVCDKWTEELDNKNCIDIVYLDFQKAFDSVPHQRLLTKLKGYGFKGKLLTWVENFLKNRKQVDGSSSDLADVTSGIPLGSVLGPTLFLIYINDLPDVVHNFVKLFADDAKLYAVVNTVDDAKTVQDDLSRIDNWSDIWQI